MSPVRRRQPRKARRWLIPLLLLAALPAFFLIGRALKNQPTELPAQRTAVHTILSSRETAEIARILIENRYDAPYALVQSEGAWSMEGDPGFDFWESLLEDIVQNAALIETDDTVGDLAEHPEWQLSHFGLAEPAARVTVEFTGDDTLSFRIGDSVPQENPANYFLLEGDSHIYTMSTDVFEAYTYPRIGLHAVRDPALKGDVIDAIAFSGGEDFRMERRADGWYLTEPLEYPLSDAAVKSLLDKLEGLRFAQYVDSEASADLPALGLSPARRRLTLNIGETVLTGYDDTGSAYAEARLPAYQLVFDLGNSENDILFYCLYRGDVVLATAFSAGFLLTQNYDSLLLTAPFNAPTNDLMALRITDGGETVAYSVSLRERVLPNNEFELDESGNILYDVAVTRDGAAIDSDAFLTAYGELLALRTEDRLPAGWEPASEPLLSISFDRSASSRTVSLYPLDALHSAVAVDGAALYQVEKGWGERIGWP